MALILPARNAMNQESNRLHAYARGVAINLVALLALSFVFSTLTALGILIWYR